MSHILIVEDEAAVREAIQNSLLDYTVSVAGDLNDAIGYLRAHHVDLVLLDLRLGRDDGMKVAQYVRENHPYVALVILTGHGGLQTALDAIALNVQAYLLKPVSPDQLKAVVAEQIAYMQAHRERDLLAHHMRSAIDAIQTHHEQVEQIDRLVAGKIVLDRRRYEVFYGGREVTLSMIQFRILWQLVEAAGEIITPHDLALNALGYDIDDNEANNTIRGHIAKIRSKLNVHVPDSTPILTVRNQGYMWTD